MYFNPTSPDIGSAERSFSADVKVVEECVKQIAEVANANGIQLCLKHFPGTGAARANPHDDLMDLSKNTSDDQVNIFENFVADGADGAFQSRFGQSVGKEHAGVS